MERNEKTDIVLISVIIPVYNRTEYIADCIESVLNQSLRPLEIIIVDDGSKSSCYDSLKKYECDNNEIVLIRQEHKGAWAARNLGIQNAKGEYICFMDSDDYYASCDTLEKLYTMAKTKNALICGGNIINVYSDGRKEYRGDVFHKDMFYKSSEFPQMFGHTRYIYDRKFILSNGLNYSQLKRFEDPPFVLKTFIKAKQYYGIKDEVYCCRNYKRNKNYSYDVVCDIAKGVKECFYICKKYGLDCRTIEKLDIRYALGSSYAQCAYYHWLGNNLLDDILISVNQLQKELLGVELDFFDKDKERGWISSCIDSLNKIKKAHRIVIYGAGYIGKELVESGLISKETIVGYAVTSKNDIGDRNGIIIRTIDIYKDEDALIVIAVKEDKKADMVRKVLELGCQKYCYIEENGIKLGQYLISNDIDYE